MFLFPNLESGDGNSFMEITLQHAVSQIKFANVGEVPLTVLFGCHQAFSMGSPSLGQDWPGEHLS